VARLHGMIRAHRRLGVPEREVALEDTLH
jgi:hypothetical protein